VAVSVVKFAGSLSASVGGFVARFDSSGTYQPTIGNVVLFACPNDGGDTGGCFIVPGWTLLEITTPATFTTPNVIWKIWSSEDNTTTVLDPVFTNCYIAYELTGINPSNPLPACGFGFESSPPNVPILYPPAVTNDGSLALFLFYTQGRADLLLTPSPTYDNSFAYDGGATLQVPHGDTAPGGLVMGATRAPSNSGDNLSATAFGVPTDTEPYTPVFEAVMPLFSPASSGPPSGSARTTSGARRFYSVPLRPQVSRF
jgi:hypothetical protein